MGGRTDGSRKKKGGLKLALLCLSLFLKRTKKIRLRRRHIFCWNGIAIAEKYAREKVNKKENIIKPNNKNKTPPPPHPKKTKKKAVEKKERKLRGR